MSKRHFRKNIVGCLTLAALSCAIGGCGRRGPGIEPAARRTATARAVANSPSPCELILATHAGESRLDQQVRQVQTKLRTETNTAPYVEKLGWLFVAKARASFDPGYYKLAEQCALCLGSHEPRSPEALLLRGHVLQNLHQFKEAEVLARELVVRRGRSFDYGLLGDALMEQGRLGEAAAAYQKMVDEKPDLQAYARIAHLRWLKGDLAGALAIQRLAASAASPNSPETAAWVNTRLALLQFQNGDLAQAVATDNIALDYQPDYPPALLLRGRLLLARRDADAAVAVLQRAVQLNPLPDYQWTLSEALRAAGRGAEAEQVEAVLMREGAASDPRTFALYLASRGQSPATALELAQAELNTRRDVFTHDSLAWALAANGKIEQARTEIQLALAEGTKDARLCLHAAVIASRAGAKQEARAWLDKVAPMLPLLLPSEHAKWQNLSTQLAADTDPVFTPAN